MIYADGRRLTLPTLDEHAQVELDASEVVAQTIGAKVRELEALVSSHRESIAAAEAQIARQLPLVARLECQIAAWRELIGRLAPAPPTLGEADVLAILREASL